MARLPLLGGSYSARSIIASCSRCINLYPELNPKDAPVPLTYYQRPGLVLRAQGPAAPVRGIYRASNGNAYCVIGQNVYSLTPQWQLVQLGQLLLPGTTPVSMIDNGVTLWLVDNSPYGYSITLATNAFAQVQDPTQTFIGATRVEYLDGFLLWNMPGTPNFGSTLSNELAFDATYWAAKNGYPDALQTLAVNRRELVLLGTLKGEVWYDAGNTQFPFAALPGAYIEHGCVAPWSVATSDLSVFWLGQDLQGQGVVFRQRGYETTRISNHGLEEQLRLMVKAGANLADAIGYTYQQGGHYFYVLSFPSGDQTWAFDDSISEPAIAWSQRAWSDANGTLHRDRTNCQAFAYGQNLVGDWENGAIYSLDLDSYTDNGEPVSYLKTFPHIAAATDWNGRPLELADGKRVQFLGLELDMECGGAPLDAAGNPAQVWIRWSDDRGKTWGTEVLQSAGEPGKYNTWPQWKGLGVARDRVFEVGHSIAGPAALNGAWVDARVLTS